MAEQYRFKVPLPKNLSGSQKRQIAEDVILFIQERTQQGVNNRGREFPEYTDEYADRKGVSPDDVDLTLTEDMLAKLQLLQVRKDHLWIGYKKGDKINGKVEGNMIGSYGRDPDPSKARPFLDFIGRDQKRILRKIIKDNL